MFSETLHEERRGWTWPKTLGIKQHCRPPKLKTLGKAAATIYLATGQIDLSLTLNLFGCFWENQSKLFAVVDQICCKVVKFWPSIEGHGWDRYQKVQWLPKRKSTTGLFQGFSNQIVYDAYYKPIFTCFKISCQIWFISYTIS